MKFDTIIMCIVDMIYRYIESSLKTKTKEEKQFRCWVFKKEIIKKKWKWLKKEN